MYKFIESLRPYFFSLREIKENVSLDLKLPVSWKYEQIAQVYKTLQIKIQDKNDKSVLVSFVSTATEDGYETVHRCANEVVEKNLEEEKKRELFEKKVREMREIFDKLGLDELEKIKFDKDAKEYDTEGLRLVGEGDEERSVGVGESEDEDDSRTEDDEQGGFFPISTKKVKNK